MLKASLTELEATGIQPSPHQSLGTGQSMELAHDEMRRVAAGGVSVGCLDDSTYPAPLKQTYDPPLILYVRVCTRERRGHCPPGDRGSWARVIPHLIGWGRARRMACDLAKPGPGNFQRLVPGVEAAAHRGAIHAKGQTVAGFGTGVDIIYPKENSRITEQILALGGALVSEFPLNTFAPPQTSPFANRFISGISIGVRVVEAEYSGTRTPRAVRWSRIARSSPSPAT